MTWGSGSTASFPMTADKVFERAGAEKQNAYVEFFAECRAGWSSQPALTRVLFLVHHGWRRLPERRASHWMGATQSTRDSPPAGPAHHRPGIIQESACRAFQTNIIHRDAEWTP